MNQHFQKHCRRTLSFWYIFQVLVGVSKLQPIHTAAERLPHKDSTLVQQLSEDGLVIQTVIPKCGTSSVVHTMANVWQYIYSNQDKFPIIPFYSGKCQRARLDKVEKCVEEVFSCAPFKKCKYRPATGSVTNHLSLSEIEKGYLVERGIDLEKIRISKVYYITILRNPIKRVASEYHHWKRGWCCGWFFSETLKKHKYHNNFTLSDFVKHIDCPANNRQTWMLADLPFLETVRSSGESGLLRPSHFSQYFPIYYQSSVQKNAKMSAATISNNYTTLLNQDVSMLNSAKLFLEKADAVGITEDLPTTVALFFAAMFSTPSQTVSTSAPTKANQNFLRLFKQREEGNGGCFDLSYGLELGNQVVSSKDTITSASTSRVMKSKNFVPHIRSADPYEISQEERFVIAEHNKNDLALYELAVQIHRRQVQQFNLCKNTACNEINSTGSFKC